MKGKTNVKFPRRGMRIATLAGVLEDRLSEIPSWHSTENGFRLGFAQTRPTDASQLAYKMFLDSNSNNSGFREEPGSLKGTRRLEHEVISMVADLLGDASAVGYLSTGGTEGNIQALWLASNVLNTERQKIAVVRTALTHYSITKGASILGLREIDAELSPEYVIDVLKLKKQLISESKKGMRGFIVVATAGYLPTGTVDDIPGIADALEEVSKETGAGTYLHVDAAIGGFVLPFTGPKLKFDFRTRGVSSIIADMHKTGLAPYPASIFLVRSKFREAIRFKIAYADASDWALSGSRPGAAAASSWAAIKSLGFDGYRAKMKKCMAVKNRFAKRLLAEFKRIEILNSDSTNILAVNFNLKSNGRLPVSIEDNYRLYPFACKGKTWYRFCIMPHVTDEVLNEVIAKLKKTMV